MCGSAIARQYPLVEFGTGAVFLMTFLMAPPFASIWQYAGFAALLVFWASFILILVVDVRHTLVPLPFAYALILSSIVVRLSQALYAGSTAPLIDGSCGALAFGGGIALIVYLTRGKGMGSGDIYIAAAIGALFGLMRGIEVALMSFWIGAIVGIILMALKKGVRMKTELPFAPFMFVASLIGAFTAFSPIIAIASLVDTL
jgi:leader peptidase (prepilin peptidase)/N-methyltransferase